MYYFDWTYGLMLIGLVLGLIAQSAVKRAYREQSRVATRLGRPAAQVVAEMLHRNGNDAVSVARTSGELTDHYNPANEVLSLSDGVYNSTSVAALGIAAHEAGHAMQKLEGYAPLKLRGAIVPVVNIGSFLAWPIFVLGLAVSWQPLLYGGIALFALTVVFSLITLPVELDASRRAMAMLIDGGYVTADEETGVRKVLRAAAMTYVAAAIASILNLVRLLLIANGGRRRD